MRLAVLSIVLAACVPRDLVESAKDRDNDGYAAWQVDGDDCDDDRPAVNPGADEVCDNDLDDDCDGAVDDDGIGATTWYADADGDLYGDLARSLTRCVAPTGFVATAGDCDDALDAVNPAVEEICGNSRDDDCDEAVDDVGVGASTWYQDHDGDGHGLLADTRVACTVPDGYVALADDCADGDPDVHPGVAEVCNNGKDDNCDDSAAPCELRGVIGLGAADVKIRGTTTNQQFGRSMTAWEAAGETILAAGSGMIQFTTYFPGAAYVGAVDATSASPLELGVVLQPPTVEGYQNPSIAMVACDLGGDADPEFVLTDLYQALGNVGGFPEFVRSSLRILGTPPQSGWPNPIAEITSTDPATNPGASFGRPLVCGDVTGDGHDDLVVAINLDQGVRVYAGPLTGSMGVQDHDLAVPTGHELLDGADIDGDGRFEILTRTTDAVHVWGVSPAGFLVSELAVVGPAIGWSATALDFDGDEFMDLAVVEKADSNDFGRILLYQSSTLASGTSFDPEDADLTIVGTDPSRLYAVGTPGDLDGDGDEELCVLSPTDESSGASTGAMYCFFDQVGPTDTTPVDSADLVLLGEAAGSALGQIDLHRNPRMLRDTDLDGDGINDLVVGWPYNDVGAANSGAVYVLYGLTL